MSLFASYPGRVYASRGRVREFIMVDDESIMTAEDARIDRALVNMSELIEALTGRTFIPHVATYNYDYERSWEVHFFKDLLSVTSFSDYTGVVDADSYVLYPLDAPSLVPPQPYRWLEMDRSLRLLTYGSTPRAALEIAGKWGYAEVKRLYGKVLDGDINAAVTTLSLTKSIGLSPGSILLLDDEQIFVNDADDVLIPVVTRGINGTTAASHTAATVDVYTLHAPGPIEDAVCVLVARSLARGASGWADLIGSPSEGYNYFKELPSEVATVIKRYRDMELQNFRVLNREYWWNVGTNLPS